MLMAATAAVGLAMLAGCSGAPTKADIAKAQMEEIKSAIELYRFDLGHYPPENQGLAALSTMPPGIDPTKWPPGGYLSQYTSLPNDPWGHPYVYKYEAGSQPKIICYGSDGEPGGSGDASDIEVVIPPPKQ
jgi:general secretion pathway protein G